ncbi:MAG TPA: hypothetical protein VF424_15320, partial [Vicinamibacterales bacterium]
MKSKPPASRSVVSLLLVSSALAGLASCERTKTSSPLSPQVAGPMEGVTVTPAVLAEPPVGQRIKDGEQPVKLVIINPTSNIDRPLTMTVQVAADTSFTGPSYSQTGVTPSSSGVTRLTLPGKLPGGRTYYWRVKADDGANTSGWSTVSNFVALEAIVLGTPDPRSPAGNVRVATNMPEFEVGNATASGPVGGLWYQFQ